VKRRKLLLIEPHSDDGAISAGGYLEKFKESLDYYFVLVVASDLPLAHNKFLTRNERLSEFEKYVGYFKGKWLRPEIGTEKLPLDSDSMLDLFPKKTLVALIEKAIFEIEPDILMVTGPSFHHDHTAVYEATIAALRPTAKFIPKEVYILENPTYVHSSNPMSKFQPDTFVQLDDHEIEKKIENFKNFFPSQVRESENYLSPEGIFSWARYRGIEARVKYAEAFTTFFKLL
jgi:LmbE family N-acetylglucosaminyl deacetylase